MTRLGDVATYINGFAFAPDDWSENGLPIIRIQDLTGNSYQMNRYAGEYNPKYEVNRGDVLISWSASLGVYVWQGEKALLNQHIFKVIFDKCDVDKSFYVHQVAAILEKAASQAHGATMKHLTKPVFDALPFYLPDLPTQQRIADTLDKVSEGIGMCRKMLGKLDLMVKAKFVEMFGDVVQNSKQLPIKTLPEISENLDSRRIPITGSVREKGIYPYYGASGIVDYVKDYLFDEDILLISEDGANLLARSTPIAFSAAGKVWVNNHAHVLRFRDRATQCYVENFLNMIDISNYVTGTAQPKLNQAKLNAIPIPTPELASQKQFMEFTRQIEKIKLTSCEVLDKMETEKLALMQKYFA